jgi:hypothetical protein
MIGAYAPCSRPGRRACSTCQAADATSAANPDPDSVSVSDANPDADPVSDTNPVSDTDPVADTKPDSVAGAKPHILTDGSSNDRHARAFRCRWFR